MILDQVRWQRHNFKNLHIRGQSIYATQDNGVAKD